MFVSILNETFTTVRADMNKQGNDYEIVDFMMVRFKKWTGIGGSAEPSPNPNDPLNAPSGSHDPHGNMPPSNTHVQDFPDRIERLLQSISSVYMDNDNINNMYQKK